MQQDDIQRNRERSGLDRLKRIAKATVMKLELYHGDILDLQADVLICSANVSLNLSGGVGGALLARFGAGLQEELHGHLPKQAPRFAKPGDVVVTRPGNTPYKAVLHAVAVDAFYDSNSQLITETVRKALRLASREGARCVALTALATGYGHLSIGQFAEGLRPLLKESFAPVQTVIVAVQADSVFSELVKSLPEGTVLESIHDSERVPRTNEHG
ncbi:MAG: Appr-1-p processing protein [Verrucomicrobia bacterium]|nr:Appr-1-p processing protein [Verrucomicrobiota bacterium]